MNKRLVLWVLAGVLALAAAIWLLQGLPDGQARAFVLKLRTERLVGLLLVGISTGMATILFQTVAANRVLTPQIMGFDALYMLMQTLLVAAFGIAGFAGLPAGVKFTGEVAVMVLLAAALFGTLLGQGVRDIPRTILTGVILGILFRSLNTFVGRVLDPNEFAVVQQASFASFSKIDAALLPAAGALTLIGAAAAMLMASRLDVLGLGRDPAVSLGLHHRRVVLAALAIVALLVSVSTALIGPVTFFGLIVAGLTHGLTHSACHRVLLPASAMIAAITLILGQTVFERVLGQAAFLSVVIEFAGGLFFLLLLIKGRIR
ncbi:iron chelate uptake ABC transporter family permease subunit [Paracoccus litorisediminis]|uniref:Iron chelate uptake ABC transporter family permease subunit n=1 Tax=Paracoccus litorisediminis TaxID=2006130 RepID=A0A844HIX7_9RHOB|nr:iron chelate uptake ABC transporter family permease subunit [Paracoccus litorisediminis]MTH58979.1 iron chelate uptake ABC transporter family permease subunit [Paracoccus litorisediminis]